jgi:hypothetical protein
VYAAENRALVASQVANVTVENPSTAQKFHSLYIVVRKLEVAEIRTTPYLQHLLLACSLQGDLIRG